jgi:hypothetical protein
MQLTAGIFAEKALVQHLCERFHDPDNVHIFILSVSILCRRKFCVQEVLMHMCLPPFYPNAFFGLIDQNDSNKQTEAQDTQRLYTYSESNGSKDILL